MMTIGFSILAALPILALLGLIVGLRWGVQKAGPVSWLAGLLIAWLAFGMTYQVLWVSQARGLFLSLFVLAVLWPALLLYNIVDCAGGIHAIAAWLKRSISDHGLLLVIIAWAFSALLEGLAGFGLPIAVVAPMLVSLGVAPVLSVAAVAVGHAWAVTFGDMGVIFQTLVGVTRMDPALLAPSAALVLGVACLVCGLCAAFLLGHLRQWPRVLGLGLLMAAVQYLLAVGGLAPLGALGAGTAGVAGGMLLSRAKPSEGADNHPAKPIPLALVGALTSYSGLVFIMAIITLPGPLHSAIFPFVWQPLFPEVMTRSGFITLAGPGQAFRVFLHPGMPILLAALASYIGYRRVGLAVPGDFRRAAAATWRSAAPASLGIVATVGLAALMEHTGMTQLLASQLAALMGSAFPLISPLIGILGAFATGSNNNSNILFAPLQASVANLLAMDPRLLIATQTAGGSLGSMIAPAKIVVGCSTVGLKNREGEVLRLTLLYGLGIGLLLGGLVLFLPGVTMALPGG